MKIKLEEIATEPERRVFYIDVSELSLSEAEKVIDRIKDEFRKKRSENETETRGNGCNLKK